MRPTTTSDLLDPAMQATGFESLSPATRGVVWLATLAAVAALGVAGAYWTWTWFAPRPEPKSQAPASAIARLDAAYRLFGDVRVVRSASATPGATTLRLLGLVTSSGDEPGYAVLMLDGKRSVAVRQGGEIEPGTRLVEVGADHVVLDRRGMRETLALPRQGKDAATAARHAR
jgi:general secretion pathway protein C